MKFSKIVSAGICLALGVLFCLKQAYSYPTAARHGYTSCVTCHHNPSGGGVLTSYGKFIAGELFGAFNDSSDALPWLLTPEEEDLFVGMVMARMVQAYRDTTTSRKAHHRFMQLDFEAGLTKEGWQAIVAFGPKLDSAIEGREEGADIQVRRWWVGKVVLEYAIRAGKFFPEYGIYHYNHNIPSRKGLYFNHDEEPLIFQATWFTQTFDFTGAYMQGSDNTELADHTGYSINIAYKFGPQRIGVSHLSMKVPEKELETSTTTANLSESVPQKGSVTTMLQTATEPEVDKRKTDSTGFFVQAGYLKYGYTLLQVDQKNTINSRGNEVQKNLVYLETAWEFYKGVNPYFAYEYNNTKTGIETTINQPALGIQLHLITHTELVLQAGQGTIDTAGEKSPYQFAFAMLNIFF